MELNRLPIIVRDGVVETGIGNGISLQRIYEYEVRVMAKLTSTQEEHGENKIHENIKCNTSQIFHSVMPSKLCLDSFSW